MLRCQCSNDPTRLSRPRESPSLIRRSSLTSRSRYYMGVLVSMLCAAMALVTFWPLQLPVWGLFLAILIAVLFLIPVGIIAAVTNTTLGLNVITEFVAGYLFPGRPIANIVFKVFGYMTLVQSIDLTSDMKLGLCVSLLDRLYGANRDNTGTARSHLERSSSVKSTAPLSGLSSTTLVRASVSWDEWD
jgi:hypothetical protein